MATDETKDIKDRIEVVSASNKKLLKKRNKIDYIAFGGIGVLYIVLAVMSGIAGNWSMVLIDLLLLVCVVWLLLLNLQLNMQRFTIDMMFDLRQLEREELDDLLDSLEKNATKAVDEAEKLVKKVKKEAVKAKA